MKVLLVCEDIPATALGGLGKHVVALGHALMDAGHEVALMGRDQPSYEQCAAEVGFRGRFIAGFGNPFPGWKERQLGVAVPAKRPHVARRIAQAILAHAGEFDVVHYHGHHPMVGRYLPVELNFLQTRHDQGSDCITHVRFRDGQVCRATDPAACAGCMHPAPGPLRSLVTAAAVKRYRRETAEAFARHPVVFVSEFLRRNARRTLPETAFARSAVVHNFCDEQALARLPKANPGAGFTVHVAGRLEPAKGILAFLQRLAPRLPANWTVNVFGDGPLRTAVAKISQANGIKWHGHTSLSETLASAAASDVVVMPSQWEEPFGMVTLEALRLGKRCLALDLGGTPELVAYGSPGQLALFSDLDALVEHLLAGLPAVSPGGESASVQARLPELLRLYQRQSLPDGQT